MKSGFTTVIAFALCVCTCAAQDYPDKPIRMLVPVLPGGAPDFSGRIVAERLSVRLGQKVVVENRAGAGGVIALEVLKASPPNGYTIAAAQLGPLPCLGDKGTRTFLQLLVGAVARALQPELETASGAQPRNRRRIHRDFICRT